MFSNFFFNKDSENKFDLIYLAVLFLLNFIFQSFYYNYESINWDISSYLVASDDLLRGNFPYENQWESKQPLFYLMYGFLTVLAGKNLIVFKILNDLFLFCIVLVLYKTIKKISNNKKAFLGSLFYISFMSQPWSSAEFSEIYSLFFISLGYFYFIEYKNYFLTGFLLAISSLINIGSFVFVLPYLYILLRNFKNQDFKWALIKFSIGVLVPHSILVFVYFLKNLLPVYYQTLIGIPSSYTEENFSFTAEISTFLRSMYLYNKILFVTIIMISCLLLLSLFNKNSFTSTQKLPIFLFVFSSLLFYLLASHGYYHHLLFFLYFFSLSITYIEHFPQNVITAVLIFLLVISVLTSTFKTSFSIIQNLNNIYESYPLRKVAESIDDYFESEYKVLALDGVLVLHYLNLPNFSYVIHPSNHNEKFISDGLYKVGKVGKNEIASLIDQEPDVILCSNNQIINCEIYDYKQNYFEVDILFARQNPYLQFYDNQTFGLRLFIRDNEND